MSQPDLEDGEIYLQVEGDSQHARMPSNPCVHRSRDCPSADISEDREKGGKWSGGTDPDYRTFEGKWNRFGNREMDSDHFVKTSMEVYYPNIGEGDVAHYSASNPNEPKVKIGI